MIDKIVSQRAFDLLGFGEVMLRLSPMGMERISQCEQFEKRAGGSELNVVSGVSLLGLRTGIITKLPDNEIGSFIKNKIRFYDVSDDYLIFDQDKQSRLGIYYYESGAHPRKPLVCYDRRYSSINSIRLDEIPDDAYASTRMFHVSGISLALSGNTREIVKQIIQRFKKAGVLISFDVNYRANLWDEPTARATIEEILPEVDILFVSEETSRRMMGRSGTLDEIMKGYCSEFGVSMVATTVRTVVSPTRHNFTSKIYSATEDLFYEEPGYTDIEVVDRIGSGDAYIAGVLYHLLKDGSVQHALEFGNAMSAVKNTIPGDMPASDLREIQSVIATHKKIGPSSELSR